MTVTVDEALRGSLALGILGANVRRRRPCPPAFEAECDQTTARFTALYAGKPAVDIPAWPKRAALFHRLDLDPTKTRPSSEALLRRVIQGRGMPRVHPVVDVCNLCSLEHQLPLGLYDRDRLRGELQVRLGRSGEGYAGIRKQRVHLGGRLLISDDDGPFGAPTSDSAHTAISAETRNLLVVVYCPVERAGHHLSSALERIADLLTRYCAASVIAVRVVQ
jgi:DNA/RNA-binding domain of Phe-tRNA-synthetase-like protein